MLAGRAAVAQKLRWNDLEEFVAYMNAHHKAPFDREGAVLPPGGAASLMQAARRSPVRPSAPTGTNVKVNRDRDPWPKAEIAAAVDPTNAKNYLVMSNDFRENFDHMFFHTSTNGGKAFTDDSMVGGADPVTGFIPLTFQSDPGVTFDNRGNSVLSTISGNLIFDFNASYENLDTEVYVTQGFAGGTYASLLPTPVDDQQCSGTFDNFVCSAQLDKPFVTADGVPGSPHNGTVYVYYTLFCNENPCTDGNATVPAFSSAILESHSPGAGLPFSPPALVSGKFTNTQFSDMVIDSTGTPHIFFDDFSDPQFVKMYMSTLKGGHWVVSGKPVATFVFQSIANIFWGFRIFGTVAPGCSIWGTTAYCAFSANQIQGGPVELGLSVYLATVDTTTGTSSVHRVNNDTFGNSKDHFFPWAAAKGDGSVYVGWYDDRNDPFNTKVEYFVGKSGDGGMTFPTQQPVSSTSFNPCDGFPGCGFFGDYTQLVAGSDGVVHAAWSDTRDGASMQIFSQSVTW